MEEQKTPEQKEEIKSTPILEQARQVADQRAVLKAENDALDAELARAEMLKSQAKIAGKSEMAEQPKPETPREYVKRMTGL